jgi:hypothetical protein
MLVAQDHHTHGKVMQIALGTLLNVAPREVWLNEAYDFTPWLAKNLSLLGSALGMDLELVRVESAVGSYSCDIEAVESGTGRRVVIENQLEQTDHNHLGQLLTYAAGLDAAVVIWISTKVRDEHREAIDFLNRHTRDGLDFFAIALELVRIGDSQPAPIFRLAASPNAWAKSASAAANVPTSDRMIAYQAFFQPLMDELRETHFFTNAKAAQPQSWYAFSSGTTGVTYVVTFTSKSELRAELYIDVGSVVRNKAIFDHYVARQAEIEASVGAYMNWDRLDGKRASRISVVLAGKTIEDAAKESASMRQWAIVQLLALKRAFGPSLKEVVQMTAQLESAEMESNF